MRTIGISEQLRLPAANRLLPSVFGAVLSGLLLAACATLQIPQNPPGFKASEYLKTDIRSLRLEAKPIEGVREYWRYFDDNLPQIGIGVIWVSMQNHGQEAVDFSHSKWHLEAGPRRYGRMDVSEVFDRYYKERHIRMYSIQVDSRARLDLSKLSLDIGILQPSSEAKGFVFFRIDPSTAPAWTKGVQLSIAGIRAGVGKRTDIALPLSYANPRD